MNPSPQTVRRTFGLETVRSVAVGVQETAFQTFAILIALKHFESGPAVKSLILASQAVGLIGSLFIIPWVQRSSIRLNHAAAGISFSYPFSLETGANNFPPRPGIVGSC